MVRQVQTCDSRGFFRLQRWYSNVQSKFVCTRRQATPQGKHGMIWDGRREGSRRRVPGLAAKTEEDERRRTGKRMVDLTLNETFNFETCTSSAERGRRGEPAPVNEEKSMCGEEHFFVSRTDIRTTPGPESSTHIITRHRNFRVFSGSL